MIIVMNNKFFKKSAIVNVILITCVGALHTMAVAAMIYQAPVARQADPTENSMSFNVMEMAFLGESEESVVDAKVEIAESLPFEHPVIEEVVEQEIVAVQSVDQADVVIPEKKQVTQKIKEIKPVKEVKEVKEVREVKKVQKVVQSENVAKQAAKQQMKGGKPLVSSSQIKFIKNPAPKRPRIAHRNQWTGNSVVILELDQRGMPVKVVLERSSGHDVLDKAALEAARGVKIHPYIEQGQKIAIRHRIDYAF